jgi:inorganic pyrophosphatase
MEKNHNYLVQAHPWHGIPVGEQAPEVVSAFIELVPLDTVKYEIDKLTGHLKVDRPHKYSSLCPTLYGFIPRTYCGSKVAELAVDKCGRLIEGDKDPLDICVLTEATITRSNIIVSARPIGGLRMIDTEEVDDKIIAVLQDDPVYNACADLTELPDGLLERLEHYFLTYKQFPGGRRRIEILDIYGVNGAYRVINSAIEDYREMFK